MMVVVLPACARGVPPASSGAGPAPVAEQAMRGCGGEDPGDKVPCYEDFLLRQLEAEGVRSAMETLDALARSDRDVKRDGHVFAHAIGLAAYESPQNVGSRFARCMPIFQSGCYHGVIQAYFMDLGDDGAEVDSAAVNELCESYRGPEGDRWLLFQCAHGLGHGLVMFRGHELPEALAGCDLLADRWEWNACLGGAFMENIVNATAPHHSAASLVERADTGDHAGGGHGEGGHHSHHASTGAGHGATAFEPLDPDDPHYPCSTLDERYLNACYQMQTSAVLFHNGGDMGETADFCASAPESVRHTCFQSLGRDISGYTLQDADESRRLCARVDPPYRSWCHVGVVKNFIDVTADASDGLTYCRAIPGDPEKSECYEAVGEQIWVLEETPAARTELCGRAEPDYVGVCRRAAGVAAGP